MLDKPKSGHEILATHAGKKSRHEDFADLLSRIEIMIVHNTALIGRNNQTLNMPEEPQGQTGKIR